MKRIFVRIALFTFAFILFSCNNDDKGTNFHFTALRILQAELPASFELNERYQIKVTYERPNNCTFFEGFDVTSADTTIRDVTVIGSVFDDEDCAEVIEEVEATFDFIVLHNQPYTFRFWQGKNESGEHQFLEVMVPVN